MQLPEGSGLEALDKMLRRSIRYYSEVFKSDNFRKNIFRPIKLNPPVRLPTINDLKRPLESLLKGLDNAVSMFSARPESVDYGAVVNSFLPPGARLVKPQYPDNSNEIQFADIDGDNRSELIASYKSNDGIRTLILKKDSVQWFKMAEISNPEFDAIHYRNAADVAGDGKSYLLLGLSKQRERTLFAYSLSDGSARKIFSKNYGKLELQKTRIASGRAKDAIALWHEEIDGVYDIELVHWNGIDLENLNQSRYLTGKVIPYHVRKLRQNPNDATSWYNLADSLANAGDASSAARALEHGLRQNPDALLRSRFDALKNRL